MRAVRWWWNFLTNSSYGQEGHFIMGLLLSCARVCSYCSFKEIWRGCSFGTHQCYFLIRQRVCYWEVNDSVPTEHIYCFHSIYTASQLLSEKREAWGHYNTAWQKHCHQARRPLQLLSVFFLRQWKWKPISSNLSYWFPLSVPDSWPSALQRPLHTYLWLSCLQRISALKPAQALPPTLYYLANVDYHGSL